MSLEAQIAALVSAANALTGTVNGQLAALDAAKAQMQAQIAGWLGALPATRTYYVDAIAGDDSGPGTIQAPFRSLFGALWATRLSVVKVSTTYCLGAGQTHEMLPDQRISLGDHFTVVTAYDVPGYGTGGGRPVVRFKASATQIGGIALWRGVIVWMGVDLATDVFAASNTTATFPIYATSGEVKFDNCRIEQASAYLVGIEGPGGRISLNATTWATDKTASRKLMQAGGFVSLHANASTFLDTSTGADVAMTTTEWKTRLISPLIFGPTAGNAINVGGNTTFDKTTLGL